MQSVSDLDVALFDECHAIRGIGLAYLTIGMFWTRPDICLSLDKKNLASAKLLGVSLQPKNGSDYVQWLSEVQNHVKTTNWEF